MASVVMGSYEIIRAVETHFKNLVTWFEVNQNF